MRVLFLTNQLEVGGIERNLVRLTAALVARGHEVEVATRGGPLVERVVDAGGSHHELEIRLRLTPLIRDVARLRRLVREFQPDVIHVFSASTGLLAWLLRRTRMLNPGGPRPLHVSSLMGLQIDPDEGRAKVLLRALATSLGADRVIVMAPAIERVVDALRIGPRRKVQMWVVGVEAIARVDPSARAQARSELGVEDEPVVMTIGRLDASKSHDLFIRAAAHVIKEAPDTRFIIIGGGPLHEDLENEIEELGVANAVQLVGERLDAVGLLAAADVYVRPGVVEGFVGITVIEAQMRGVPVVSFDTEDVRLSIKDDETGLLARNGDVGALADAIVALLRDPERSARLVDAAETFACSNFSLNGVIEKLESLYSGAAVETSSFIR